MKRITAIKAIKVHNLTVQSCTLGNVCQKLAQMRNVRFWLRSKADLLVNQAALPANDVSPLAMSIRRNLI